MKPPHFLTPESSFYPIFILTNVILTTFLAVMTAVATIIGDNSIQGELALSDTETIWLTTLYLLGVNTTVPTATWFAERVGYKRMYTYGVFLFTLGALAAGLAGGFVSLALARICEGIGAGFIFPVGLSLITQALPKEKIALALNLYIGGAFGGGLGLGLPLAGYFTQFHSWRGIFLLIFSFGLLTSFSCWISRPPKAVVEKIPFDLWGFLSFATFIASFLIALTLGPIPATAEGWRSPLILGCFLLAALSLITTLAIERKHPFPLIPLSIFKDPIFSVSCVAMFLLGMSLFASVSTMVSYMINALSYEKFISGKIAMIYGITMAVFSVLASQIIKLTKAIGVPLLTFSGLLILIGSYFLNNELSWLTGPYQILWILFIRGAGIGLALGPTTILALHGIPEPLRNSAATLLTFFRQVGGTYGGTLIAIFSIRQTIFHRARFGEQASTQLPGYKVAHQKVFHQFYSRVSDNGMETSLHAKGALIRNIEIQASIQGMNDALIVFAYVTSVVTLILLLLLFWRFYQKKKQSPLSQ